ncbi:hypothetical protein QEZ54_17295 [Catellatospora sp. KI3]|uniref:hypothetical protein n=1 Tax=Catellatospora sp. KI3 TaxID=3041620 RepID=UPI0024829C53|nr:hypothetical protein [Catellatospora sp. KI3]MDI1462733.1 hypothetical protein [Catellatospora sp. KI3]
MERQQGALDGCKLTRRVRGDLPLRDHRRFSLLFYAYGHTQVLVRGYPSNGGDGDGPELEPALDLLFSNVWRVSCWKEWTSLALRTATAEERAALERRIGEIRSTRKVFLLSEDSIENYIIAGSVAWAEHYLTEYHAGPLWNRVPGPAREVAIVGDVIYRD